MQPNDALGSVSERWLVALQQHGSSANTIAAYRQALRHFCTWNTAVYGIPMYPAAIMARDVRDWQAYQQLVEHAAPTTINQRLVALRRFFAWAVTMAEARFNPASTIPCLRLPVGHPKGLSEHDLRALLRAVHTAGQLRDIAIVELLVGTGLRVGELLQLQVGDIAIHERSGYVTVRWGKGGSFRVLPLTADVRHALTNYLATQPDGMTLDRPLWLGTQGALQHRSSILRLLHKYASQAALPGIGPHTLRHTFATRYLQANPADLRGLAALLGHATLETVMIYTAPALEDLAQRMERMEVGRPHELIGS